MVTSFVDMFNTDIQSIDIETSHGNLDLQLPRNASVNLKMDDDNWKSEIESTRDGAPVRLEADHGRIRVKALGKAEQE